MLSSKTLPLFFRRSGSPRILTTQMNEATQQRRYQSGDQQTVTVTVRDRIATLTMDSGENRFSLPFMQALSNGFDEVLKSDAVALVTTSKGKFYSNGLDLEWVLKQLPDQDVILNYMLTFTQLMARLLTFPIPTVAAINGHAFAAGGIMAFAHDYRIMNNEKGWICLPEVNINVRFGPPLCELLKAKITDPKLRSDLMLFGSRYTAAQALKCGLIDAEGSPSQLVDTATELIVANKTFISGSINRNTLFTLKNEMYGDAVRLLMTKPPSLYMFKIFDHEEGISKVVEGS